MIEYNAFVLNFGGRVKLPSVKNFILINESNPTENLVLFGRVDKHEFNLDFQYPISPFQAFSFALSSLVFKWGCE
jgi:tubby and related proteins